MKRPVVGLDIFTPSDQRIILKPTSIALLKSVLKRIGQDARAAGATGPRRAVEETILSRTRDPADVELVCREKDLYKLAEKRAGLIGWLDEMPAPWIKLVNDPRERVTRLYATLHREFPDLHVPTPVYPDDLLDAGERYGVPIHNI